MDLLRIATRVLLAASTAGAVGPAGATDGVIVIGHPGFPGVDAVTLEKIYTGKVIEVRGVSVTAVNASAGSVVRNRFLQAYLHVDEDRYTAYWVVRRYIGKGASPRELPTSSAIIDFVNSTPGAIGYINEGDIQPGINVLMK